MFYEIILSLVRWCQQNLEINLLLVMFCICVFLIDFVTAMIVYFWHRHRGRDSKWYLSFIFWILVLILYVITVCIYLFQKNPSIFLVGLGFFPSMLWLNWFVFESGPGHSFSDDLDGRLINSGFIFLCLILGKVIFLWDWYFLLGFILTHIFSGLIMYRVIKFKLEKYKKKARKLKLEKYRGKNKEE